MENITSQLIMISQASKLEIHKLRDDYNMAVLAIGSYIVYCIDIAITQKKHTLCYLV